MWECSHLGGDRFAANVLVLPHGFYYGQVPGDGAELVAAHERGQVALPWLRGRAGVPPAGQAAQQHARGELGSSASTTCRSRDVHAVTAPGREVERWTVTMAGPEGDVVATVESRPSGVAANLTCRATHPRTRGPGTSWRSRPTGRDPRADHTAVEAGSSLVGERAPRAASSGIASSVAVSEPW